MARDIINRYVWLIDTIRRHGRITRGEIDRLWSLSSFSEHGEGLPRRTFINYRQAVEEIFSVNIECDPSTYEYYIAEEDAHNESVTNWMLNSAAVNDVLNSSRDISRRIFLEDVPSAREHLATIIDAVRKYTAIRFNYSNYNRSLPTKGVLIEPYFLKIFKQRWYVIGRNVGDNKVKTYALDRMSRVEITSDTFEIPADFDIENYFHHSFGIVYSHSEPRRVVLSTDSWQAKYFRALPLHHSQQESVSDNGSLFTYMLRITPDLVAEILSHGPRVTVLQPPELRAMVSDELRKAIKNYEK